MKKCGRCKQLLPEDNFSYNAQTRTNLSCYCKPCTSIINKEWRAKNPEISKKNSSDWAKANPLILANKALIRNYGVTLEDKNRLLKSQNNKCAICGRILVIGNKNTHLDHEHKTGKIRGVLCNQCNHLIGNCFERISILESAICYLTKVK